MRTNREKLVRISVEGEIAHPMARMPYRTGYDGVNRVHPGTGGITYNVRVGDLALGWEGDHVEPAVSTRNKDNDANGAYNTFACVGNEAVVISGDAKGARGVVTGTHGGIEHVIIDFQPEDMEKMSIGDKIRIQAYGQGLKLSDYPGIEVLNIDPDFLEKLGIKEVGGKLQVAVTVKVPAVAMGSGLGSSTAHRGDYDITTQDPATIKEYGLEKLRLGDIVAIMDASAFYGWSHRRGAVIIGIVVHSDSKISGHGPGVTTLLTCNHGEIVPVIDPKANIADILGLRK
ncbi:MAG: DUF4438 domain-containing protein [Bacillota bacterium]